MWGRLLFWKSSQAVARILTTLLFDLKVEGQHFVPEHGGALIVANHQSYLDPVVLAVQLRRPTSYLATSELFEKRWAAFLIRWFNGIAARQGAGDVRAMKETIHRLQNGQLLVIFPEGERSRTGWIGAIQRGVGLVVRRAGVPVVPAVIVGAYEAWPIQRKMFRPSTVRVRFGPQLNLAGLDVDEIVATIDRTLRQMFDELRGPRGRR